MIFFFKYLAQNNFDEGACTSQLTDDKNVDVKGVAEDEDDRTDEVSSGQDGSQVR